MSRTFLIEHEGVNSATLYANVLERLGFFLPQLSKLPARKPWRLSGKLYRSKSSSLSKSIYTLSDDSNICWIKSEGELVQASADFEQILGKLTLMYGARQNYGVEGVRWGELVRLGSVNFGGEAESVLLEVSRVVIVV